MAPGTRPSARWWRLAGNTVGITVAIVLSVTAVVLVRQRFAGNVRTAAVRKLCHTIQVGDSLDSVQRTLSAMAAYDAQIAESPDGPGGRDIAILSNPGWDYFFRVIVIKDRVVVDRGTPPITAPQSRSRPGSASPPAAAGR